MSPSISPTSEPRACFAPCVWPEVCRAGEPGGIPCLILAARGAQWALCQREIRCEAPRTAPNDQGQRPITPNLFTWTRSAPTAFLTRTRLIPILFT